MERYMRTEAGEIIEVNDKIRRLLEDGLDEILGKVVYADNVKDLIRVGDIVNGRRVEDGFDLYAIQTENVKVKEVVTEEEYNEVVYKVGGEQ